MGKSYVVLTGAKKNIGDFIITDRTRKLLQYFKPEHRLIQLPHWEPLEPHLETVNNSDALIIMGGPGFQPKMYPGVYKLAGQLDEIKVPIVPLGLGWKGVPGDYRTLRHYKFTESSLKLLKRMSRELNWLSCRDYLTGEVLKSSGIDNVLMTGCPVWYDLKHLDEPFKRPRKVNKLVFTPAQNPLFQKQSIQIMENLRRILPEARLICSFHRGLDAADRFTPAKDAKNNLELAAAAEKSGWETVDTSFDLERISFYDTCDIHVGYRVHGHLYFLSKRRPSILIHEDGRGVAMSEALNLRGVDGFGRGFFARLRTDKYTPLKVQHYLEQEINNRFLRFSGVEKVIDGHFSVMQEFIKNLP